MKADALAAKAARYYLHRYCETPGCKYKLPAPFAVVSIGGSQAEDIVSLILKKFK
jgi:hypothetical protein